MDKQKQLTVAVWMVTYNHGDFIENSIESVMMQKTNFNYKLFIGEDHSTDDTREICQRLKKKYPDKISLFLHDNNLGSTANGVFMYQQCFGSGAKYIALLEGDDYWIDENKLQKQVNFLDANPDYVLSFHKVKILKPNGELVDDFITKVPENYETQETLARFGNYIHTPSVVFRNVVKEMPNEFSLSPIGDYFLYLLLAEHGKLNHIEEEMAVYRYGTGIHSTNSNIKSTKANIKLFTLLISYCKAQNLKKIFLERLWLQIDYLESLIKKEYYKENNKIKLKRILLKYPKLFWNKIIRIHEK